MKRIFAFAMCFFVMCSFAVMVSADEGGIYENAGQLYEAWTSQSCVPDYITGVWSTDGGRENLTFGVIKGEAGEIGRQEILSLVRDDATVTIVYQTYSRNYLYRIQKEIVDAYFDADLGLVTAGLNEYENKIFFEVHIDFANNADTLAMIQQVTGQYGDAVSFDYVDTYPQFVLGTQPPSPTGPVLMMPNPQSQVFSFGFPFALCVILLASLFLVELRRRRIMALAADGTPRVMDGRLISEKNIEDAIRKAELSPSPTLDDRVMRAIGFGEKDGN